MNRSNLITFIFIGVISLSFSCSDEFPALDVPEQEFQINDGDFEVLFENQPEYGINIMIMGEGFTREDIESGLYKESLSSDIERLFTVYPLSDYKQHFNVYLIYAISKDEGFSICEVDDKNTALSVSFDPTKSPPAPRFRWSTWKVRRYAKGGALKSKYNHVSFVSIKNPNELPMGGVATLNRGFEGQALYQSGAVGTMAHEFGHAFASLGDEYRVEDQEQFTDSIVERYKLRTALFPNIDTVPEYESVKWSKYRFIPGYEEVGTFKGAHYVDGKMWRPEENSIMDRGGRFNAPSREAIVFRIAQLAKFYFDFDAYIERDRQEKDRVNRAVFMGPRFPCEGFFTESEVSQEVD